MVLLIILAPVIANFFQESRLTPILKMLSLTFFIASISILHQTILERNLEFKKLSKAEIISTLCGSIVGVLMAIQGFGVWSLVYQSLIIMLMTTILLWFFNTWKPKMIFNWADLKPVISYSLNYTGFRTINYFERNADYILIGRFLGVENLGYYTLAYKLMLYPLQTISSVIGRVMFPAYSQIQDNDAKFRHTYLQVVASIAIITFPIMIGLMIISKPFILTVFGLQWKPVIILLIILAPVGLVQSISTTTGEIFTAKGRTDWLLRLSIVSGLFIVLSFIIGLQWGLLGVAAAYTIADFLLLYPILAIPFRLINLRVRNLFHVLWQPFLSSVLMFILLFLIMHLLPKDISIGLTLGLFVPIGIITYLAASWMFNRNQILKILGFIRVSV